MNSGEDVPQGRALEQTGDLLGELARLAQFAVGDGFGGKHLGGVLDVIGPYRPRQGQNHRGQKQTSSHGKTLH
jgi:hypothetical protein